MPGFTGGKLSAGSYEETEGLLVNLGVVAALMLSFVVGIFFAIPREEFYFGDYRELLLSNRDFRIYAESMLDYENFNFTAPFPSGTGYQLVNIRDILNEANDPGSDDIDRYDCSLDEPYTNCNNLYNDLLLVAEFTESTFKPTYLYSYCTYHISECRLQSDVLMTMGGYATTALTIALFISVVFYISLSLSDIREEAERDNLEPLQRFRGIATHITMFGFMLLLIGVIVFFVGLVRIMRIRSPLSEPVNTVTLVNLYLMLIPSGLLLTAIACFLPRYSMWGTTDGKGSSTNWTLNPQSVRQVTGASSENIDDGL